MGRLLLVSSLVPLDSPPLAAQDRDTGAVQDTLLRLEQTWAHAYVTRDISVLERLLADDWQGWIDGQGHDRAAELADFRTDRTRYFEHRFDHVRIRVCEPTAVVEAREAARLRDTAGERWVRWHSWTCSSGRVGSGEWSPPMSPPSMGRSCAGPGRRPSVAALAVSPG